MVDWPTILVAGIAGTTLAIALGKAITQDCRPRQDDE